MRRVLLLLNRISSPLFSSLCFSISGSILTGAWLAVRAQDLDHFLGPIRQAQESDPGGFGLMIFCIGLLVTMVLGLFVGTMFYIFKSKKLEKK
ncbi:MAG: hypothetical protein K8F91_03055 [Candidatus Obscuribacterales bacterium]|nr:hypothetical protein [Candidatus Obscuribacterales bacterium]